jgi:hypothetical protein
MLGSAQREDGEVANNRMLGSARREDGEVGREDERMVVGAARNARMIVPERGTIPNHREDSNPESCQRVCVPRVFMEEGKREGCLCVNSVGE